MRVKTLALDDGSVASLVKSDGLKREIKVQIPAVTIDRRTDKKLIGYGKNTQITGFRRGKAPLSILRRRYSAQARFDVIEDAAREKLAEISRQLGFKVAGRANFTNLSEQDTESTTVDLKVELEVFPDIQLPDFAELKVERLSCELKKSDVEAEVEAMKNKFPKWVKSDAPAADGDAVCVSFRGTVSGRDFPGNSGKNVWITLGNNQYSEEFNAALKGASPKSDLAFSTVLPANYEDPASAGKTADFKVEVSEIRRAQPREMGPELFAASGVGGQSEAQFRLILERGMKAAIEREVYANLFSATIASLLASTDFEVPSASVYLEIEQRRQLILERTGAKPEELPPVEQNNAEWENARVQARAALLISKLREQESIGEPKQTSVDEVANRYAAGAADPELAKRNLLKDAKSMEAVRQRAVQLEIIQAVCQRAAVTERKVSMNELFRPAQGQQQQEDSPAAQEPAAPKLGQAR